MRAIDTYTDKEREVLQLKGMTAPRKPYASGSFDRESELLNEIMENEKMIEKLKGKSQPQGNKAQHSPLPWRLEIGEGACFHTGNRASIVRDFEDGGEKCTQTIAEVWPGDRDIDITDAKLIVRAVNHSDKLAECLRGVQWKITVYGSHWEPSQAEREAIAATLAAYEKDSQ